MINLYDATTDAPLGSITPEQLQFLIDQLEEESLDDQDYYIDANTLDFFAERGADPELITQLRSALGERESLDIRWSRED